MAESGVKYRLLKFIERLTYAAANQVWPNSQSLLNFISEKKLCKPTKLKMIAQGSTNGVNLNRFSKSSLDGKITEEIKAQINYLVQHKYLLCIGRLVADKGITELVHVFTQLQKNNTDLKLILVGEFEETLDPLPAATLHEIAMNPSIIHIGWTNYVEYYLRLAHYFVFPSHREGFPNVLLQAGAMGLPIICSRITGNVDIVTHNETGLIFECGNVPEMINLLQYAITYPERMNSMAKQLQEDITQNYRQENIWQKMLEAYKTLVH